MPDKQNRDAQELFLEAHKKGIEQAIDLSIRTGVPLVVQENGIIKEIMPQYKYVRVPIHPKKIKSNSRKSKIT